MKLSLLEYKHPHAVEAALAYGGGKGGGGAAGAIEYPPFMEDWITDLIGIADLAIQSAVTFYGPNLVQNGNFTAADGWTLVADWAIALGVLTHTAGVLGSATQDTPYIFLELGVEYLVTFTVSAHVANQVRVNLGTANGTWRGATGTFKELITCVGGTALTVEADLAAADLSIDNLSVQAIGETPYAGITAYDPTNDLATMGGLGDFYGPNLVYNGTFDSDDGWTFGAGGFFTDAGNLTHLPFGGPVVNATQDAPNIALEIGSDYRVTYTLNAVTGGNIRVNLGTANGIWRNTVQMHREIITCAGNTTLSIEPSVPNVYCLFDDLIIEKVMSRQEYYDALIDTDLDPETLWKQYVDTAMAKAPDFYAHEETQKAVDAFEARHTPAHMRSVSRFAAGMADINAVCGSAFILGMGHLEQEFLTRIEGFDATLGVQTELSRQQVTATGIASMVQMFMSKVQFTEESLMYNMNMMRTQIAAQTDFIDRNLTYSVRDAIWDIEVLQMGANLLAPLSGGSSVSPGGQEMSKGQSAISGLLGGAASGAALGAMKGSIGGPAGALIGGALGLIGGLL